MAASVFTQDGASTFAPSHGTGEDDSSDWDRFSDDGNETTSSTALSDGSGPASQVDLILQDLPWLLSHAEMASELLLSLGV